MSRAHARLVLPVAMSASVLLTFGSVSAQDVVDPTASMDPMASMGPVESVGPGLVVRDAWARETMMVGLPGAAFMVIHNGTDEDDALVGASSPSASSVEIHQSSVDAEGAMSMAPVESLSIPAHGEAVLGPGGYHVMLIDLVEPLVEGSTIEVSLEFAQAEPLTIAVPVRAMGPVGDTDAGTGHGMGHDMGSDDEAEEG